jgi:hypothetical protein
MLEKRKRKETNYYLLAAQVLEGDDEFITLALSTELSAETSLGELDSALESAGAADLDELHHVSLIRSKASDLTNDLTNESLLTETLLDTSGLDLLCYETLVKARSNASLS